MHPLFFLHVISQQMLVQVRIRLYKIPQLHYHVPFITECLRHVPETQDQSLYVALELDL